MAASVNGTKCLDEKMTEEMDGHARSRRKALKVAVGALCTEVGFGHAEESVLETLTEMLQSSLSRWLLKRNKSALGKIISVEACPRTPTLPRLRISPGYARALRESMYGSKARWQLNTGVLTEIGRSSKAYTELCGRTEVLVTDVLMAIIDQGVDVEGIPAHAHRLNKSVFIPPGQSTPQVIQRVLTVGEKQDRPGHIPDYLPSFPDPHTYIRTTTQKQPVTEYQLIREKAASQKRDVERALTRFVAKTGLTQSLFKDDASSFPLIAVQRTPQPYLGALLPKDQDLDTQDSSELHDISPVMKKAKTTSSVDPILKSDPTDADTIDNPYLLPIKPPKYRKRKM